LTSGDKRPNYFKVQGYTTGGCRVRDHKNFIIAVFFAGFCWYANAAAQDLLGRYTPEEALEFAVFYFMPRPNYMGSQWIVDYSTNKIIGYAPWDPQSRQYKIFSLKNEYYGFMRATVGEDNPPHYTQYAWYDKDNRYKAAVVTRLGGRPRTVDRPYGELGGEFQPFSIGNVPIPYFSREIEVDPLRRFPPEVDVSPVVPESLRVK
jgi:hypothetical protein